MSRFGSPRAASIATSRSRRDSEGHASSASAGVCTGPHRPASREARAAADRALAERPRASRARDASDAETWKQAADALKQEVDARRQSPEGVNLDKELANLTTYQQAFSASATLVPAAKDMLDVLTNRT